MNGEILTEESPEALFAALEAIHVPPHTARVQRERKVRARVEHRVDGRKIKKGHDRTAQLNVKMVPDIKQRVVAYCERTGVNLTDLVETALLAAIGEN